MNTRLPETPDFETIDAAADDGAAQRASVMNVIGNLVFSWSNNESVFIYVLMELLDTDFSSAAITFISLNTTRARLDLVRRLAKTKIRDDKVQKRLEKLIERFRDCTKLRNEFNHCIYQLDETGRITHTSILRITEKKSGIQIAEVKAFDDKRFEQINRTIAKLMVLNRDLWGFLPVLEQHLQMTRAPTSASAADAASQPNSAVKGNSSSKKAARKKKKSRK